MVEGTQREDHRQPVDVEKRKYVRLVEVGFAFWLAILPGVCLADMYGFTQLAVTVSIIMLLVGGVLMAIGIDGWQKWRERKWAERDKE